MTTAPSTVTYTRVISYESIRIALMLDAFNGMEIKCGNILNAYITMPVKENMWTFLGPEHGKDADKRTITV